MLPCGGGVVVPRGQVLQNLAHQASPSSEAINTACMPPAAGVYSSSARNLSASASIVAPGLCDFAPLGYVLTPAPLVCRLRALPEALVHLTSLRELRIMADSTLDRLPAFLGRLVSLERLHISVDNQGRRAACPPPSPSRVFGQLEHRSFETWASHQQVCLCPVVTDRGAFARGWAH